MRHIASRFGSPPALLLLVFVATPAWAGGDIVEPSAAPAETSKRITFDCDGGFSVDATYYFQPGRPTPIRVSATPDGKTRELMRDKDDASGWGFADTEVWVQVGGATVFRGPKQIQCKLRDAPPGGGIPTAIASQSQPRSVAAQPAAPVTAPAAPQPTQPVAIPTVAAPVPQTAKSVFVICRADSSPGQPHFYNPPVDGSGGSYATWQPAYQSYLVEKHNFKGSGIGCGSYPTAAAAQVDFDHWVANARHDSTIPGLDFKVIVTDWKFE